MVGRNNFYSHYLKTMKDPYSNFFCYANTTTNPMGNMRPCSSKHGMKTGRKCVLLLRACLQRDLKVYWLNAFI